MFCPQIWGNEKFIIIIIIIYIFPPYPHYVPRQQQCVFSPWPLFCWLRALSHDVQKGQTHPQFGKLLSKYIFTIPFNTCFLCASVGTFVRVSTRKGSPECGCKMWVWTKKMSVDQKKWVCWVWVWVWTKKIECVEHERGVWSMECGVLSMTVPYLGNPLVTIHRGEEFKFEFRFVFCLVQARRTYILLLQLRIFTT